MQVVAHRSTTDQYRLAQMGSYVVAMRPGAATPVLLLGTASAGSQNLSSRYASWRALRIQRGQQQSGHGRGNQHDKFSVPLCRLCCVAPLAMCIPQLIA